MAEKWYLTEGDHGEINIQLHHEGEDLTAVEARTLANELANLAYRSEHPYDVYPELTSPTNDRGYC